MFLIFLTNSFRDNPHLLSFVSYNNEYLNHLENKYKNKLFVINIMSEPIQIKIKKENNNGYFSAWWAKKQEEDKNMKENIEENIFEMDDDELPPKLQSPEKNGFDDVVVSEEEDEFIVSDKEEDNPCFGYPCTNMAYYDKGNKCKDSPICNLLVESVQQGFDDMRSDLKELWKKDVVKVWSAFLTVCYFNIPNEAVLCGVMYLVHKKFEQEEDRITCRSTLPPVTDSESESEDEQIDTETKKCV